MIQSLPGWIPDGCLHDGPQWPHLVGFMPRVSASHSWIVLCVQSVAGVMSCHLRLGHRRSHCVSVLLTHSGEASCLVAISRPVGHPTS